MAKDNAITPEVFKQKMCELYEKHGDEPGVFHSEADSLMCEVLTSLGYREGTIVFREVDKWYV